MSAILITTVYLMALSSLSLFGLHKMFLLYLFRRHLGEPVVRPKDPAEWPEVVVQLPVYNERYVLHRLVRAVTRLEYPKRKLHIQVLDDSDDATSRLAAKLVAHFRKQGFRFDHVRRPHRNGFKAGALQHGLGISTAGIVAIFDADFLPPPDFLKRTVPHLLEEGVGMVQTRWGHLNREYSLLTRLQAVLLDGHFVIEHFARHRSGRFFNFNGTAGVWRREAIEEAGGWQHDTLTEDLDLSYRAQLRGWRFVYLPEVVAPAELPAEINAFKNQQHRWAKGSIQTGRKLLPRIWRSALPFPVKLEATVHLTGNLSYLLMAVPSLFLIPVSLLEVEPAVNRPLFLYLVVFFMASFSVCLYYGQAIRMVSGGLWPQVLLLPAVMALGIGLTVNNGLAVLEALLGWDSPFIRTPKFRIEGRRHTWKGKRYRADRRLLFLAEFFLGIYFSWGLLLFLQNGFWWSLPFLLLFQAGFLYTAVQSFHQGMGWKP
ncbi:MAG: glycosyltransferase [Thermodesulfobacteriota bacterium]